MFNRPALLLIGIFVATAITVGVCSSVWADEFEHFERKIRPLLNAHCYSCHSSSAKTVHGGLLLDSSAAIQAGGDSGPAIVMGKPQLSLLIQAVQFDGDIQMPPKGKLSPRDINALSDWVKQGAPFPANSDQPQREDARIDFAGGRKHWSFRPVEKQPLPPVSETAWPQTRIDFFVLSTMEQEGLSPSPPADRAKLIRRLSFDLTGLPPMREQVIAFVDDPSPDAYERLVDRLLESPSYGERWARWWLDMARYTDRTASWLYQTGKSHLYRDWVVQAMNDDMPYDEFIHRQLATDLMPQTGPDDIPALGFISLSPTYWKELKLPCEIIKVIVADEWEERVDAVSRTFLGLTVACARCHDHKFDPISSEDYYALAGIFASCRQIERPLISEEEYQPVRKAKEKVKTLEAEIAKLKKEKPQPKEKLDELAEKVKQIKASTPLYDTPMANALSEESMFVVRAGKTAQDGTKLEYRVEPRNLPAFIRGNPNRPGPVIPRRFLTVLSESAMPYENGSGRLELAESITRDAAALTARVFVNRIWLEHFGKGIVSSPSNFGTQGDRPTHPRLLDDLAARFIDSGWSIKQLHREILLSATWQQSSVGDEHRVAADPDNRWLSRMNRRRLTFEQWRDAMLIGTDTLNRAMGGPSLEVDAADNDRRTLYATVHRRDMSPTLMVHDFPDPTQHSPQRTSTVTSLQGLYALNGPLLLQQSGTLAKQICSEPNDGNQRIESIYWRLFARQPTDRELKIGQTFVGDTSDDNAERWQQYLHVLLVSNEFMFVD